MHLSPIGLALLKELEGVRTHPYKDAAGLPTIGCGHLCTRSELSSGKIVIAGVPVRYAKGLTMSQIDALLRQDLQPVTQALNGLDVPLTPGQWDACACLAFNIGVSAFLQSTLVKKLRAGAYDEAPGQFRRWNIAGGRVIPGLIRRREDEITRWLEDD